MSVYKRCTKCKRRMWVGKFRAIGVKPTGESRLHPWCRECERKYHKKR